MGSGPGYRRPVVVVQGEQLNRTRIATVVVVPLTTNVHWARAHGNVLLGAGEKGLAEDSVANVSQIFAVDKRALDRLIGKLTDEDLQRILSGIDLVLGR
jgi:mRNA interferase MazF